MLPVQCYTCGSIFVQAMRNDYIEGVNLNDEHPKDVLDRIARKYKTSGKMNMCCKNVMKTTPILVDDVEYVRELVEKRKNEEARKEAGLPPIAKKREETDEIYTVPLTDVTLGSSIRHKTLRPEDRVQVIIKEPETAGSKKVFKYKAR